MEDQNGSFVGAEAVTPLLLAWLRILLRLLVLGLAAEIEADNDPQTAPPALV